MFGFIVRAAPQALLFGLLAAALSAVVDPMVDFMTDGPATQSDLLVSALTATTDNFVLVGLAALLLTFIGRAVLEARVGGAY